MQMELLNLLRCPQTGQTLHPDGDPDSGWLISDDGRHRYPVRAGIPRFVSASNYAENFGMEWNKFARTQLDSHSGHPVSAGRFWTTTGWTPEELKDRWVLDAGCGSGRFAEIALQAGANVVAIDYSSAVDSASANLGHFPNFHALQADICQLPFAPAAFDYVYCLGVLQHCPDVRRALAALPVLLTLGGRLVVDVYPRTWITCVTPKYWLRPLTRQLRPETLFRIVQKWTPRMLRLSATLRRLPLGRVTHRLIPVASHVLDLPLNSEQVQEWALLDTFDMFSPKYDRPQRARTLRTWLAETDLSEIEVLRLGHLVGRARKAAPAEVEPCR
ncbi:MAG: methyltransferase domain-containing protein [Planctomycetaceae bacterium]|nr:MAG: methyltransferase domain-containing protein [Planctomycetaceae bacterium]